MGVGLLYSFISGFALGLPLPHSHTINAGNRFDLSALQDPGMWQRGYRASEEADP